MSEKTNIAWCDSTVNFWRGCTKVSPGCANCYAETLVTTRLQGEWGKGKPRAKGKSAVKDAMLMNRKPWISNVTGTGYTVKEMDARGCGIDTDNFHRRRIFSLSLGDWLDEEVPIEWLAEMLDTIRQCDQVTWILCSKRPENFFGRMEAAGIHAGKCGNYSLMGWITNWVCAKGDFSNIGAKNIIQLTSVEDNNQIRRIVDLLKIPAACHGISAEPLLSPVSLRWLPVFENGMATKPRPQSTNEFDGLRKLDWIIIGGESGPKARPCNVEWIRSLVGQGNAAGVATFVKQLGAKPMCGHSQDGEQSSNCTQCFPTAIHDKKGGDINEWPADLRVQQWPKGF